MSPWGCAVLALASVAGAAEISPIVQGRAVTFVAVGDPSDPPRIVADFNGWRGSRMTPSGDGRTCLLRLTLDAAARIEYLIAYRDRFVQDPRNPLTVPSPAGPPRSELRMPLYRPPPALPPARRRGTIEEVRFTSRAGVARRIRVYVPAARRRGLPILYVHDGDIFVEPLGLPTTLDSLMDAGEMAPAVVAFIDAVDRHDDYKPGSPFRAVFVTEIVPLIERRYAIAAGRRALMGLSRSTVGALDTCANGVLAFNACALLAPAVSVGQFRTVLPTTARDTRFLIEAGTYDVPLINDARALRSELERRGLSVRYVESPEGHNHTAFRARLPVLLKALFPVAHPAPGQ